MALNKVLRHLIDDSPIYFLITARSKDGPIKT